jgi:hypothetical protein
MNVNTPKFNAPLPEYIDFNFLFYRWGYDQLGDNGYKQFSLDVNRHIFFGGMMLHLEYPYDYIREAGRSFFEGDNKGYKTHYFSNEIWDMINPFKDGDDVSLDHVLIGFGMMERDEQCFNVEHLLHNNERLIPIEFEFDLSTLHENYDNGDRKVVCQTKLKGYRLYPLDHIVLKRKHLMAFEQKTGFYDHGLTDNEIQEHAPDMLGDKLNHRQKKINNLHQINESRKLSTQDLFETGRVYKEIKERNPKLTKTVAMERAGEALGISGVAVRERLKKAGFIEN